VSSTRKAVAPFFAKLMLSMKKTIEREIVKVATQLNYTVTQKAFTDFLFSPMNKQEMLLEELDSLGVKVKALNDFNDLIELSWLVELLKLAMFKEYKQIYSESK